MDASWDDDKDRANKEKHGFSLAHGAELLGSDRPVLEVFDDVYPGGEERFVAIGELQSDIIAVIYSEYSDDRVRIISVRMATEREIRAYQRVRDEQS